MLQIYNTLTRKTQPFCPADVANVKMFTCGPSTYQRAHIGNYRTFLFEDILQRYIEYQGYKVTRAIALTDIEDKAILQAEKEDTPLEEITSRNEAIIFKDFALLRIKKPDYPIRASHAVDQATDLISKLLDCGYAYWYNYRGVKNIYFKPLNFRGFGKLAHLDMSKWPEKPHRFHKDTYPGTPWNMGDFIIWHGCGLGSVCTHTSVGRGRPAWNIQDAAIVTKTLGYTIDVACGGIDNLVRHHDYTLAIVESVTGKQFSRYWLHGGHLFVEGEKMSKSKGNVLYPSDVLAKGYSGAELRFFLIYGPYREKMDFTFERLRQASMQLNSLRCMISDLQHIAASDRCPADSCMGRLRGVFEVHMNNDLDVKGAFDSLVQTITEIHQRRAALDSVEIKNVLGDLAAIDVVLQCLL